MAIYRQIHTTVWKDDWIGELSIKEKLFWMYLTTNDRTTQCGVYVFSWRYAPFETGLSNEDIKKIITKFQDDGKIKFNESNNEIMITNWLKYNSARSPKVAAVIDKELKGIKTPEFESEVTMRSKDFEYPIKTEKSKFDTVSIPYRYPMDTISQPASSSETATESEPSAATAQETAVPATNPVRLYQEMFGVINPVIVQDINHWVNDLGSELVCEAMKRANFDQKGYRYAAGIMKNWAAKNINTIDQVKADDVSFENKGRKKSKGRVESLPEHIKQPPKEVPLTPEKEAEINRKLQEYLSKE
ncbi:DnaD domain-containing protein [Enterococcus dongliensis]|uniref:DnaD domain-containing protein n=1 Tax=Enterococcus dongliensis TaxID=2559925 RepID=UPI00288DF7C9|nr:DnaD domain protein [Enterococcus dongliensis]MDT2668140.1 DnaD domain protein [Enterococcus dongliensis]